MPDDIIRDPSTGHQVAYVDTSGKVRDVNTNEVVALVIEGKLYSTVRRVFGASRKFGQRAVRDSTRKLHEAAEDKDVRCDQELRNNPIDSVGHLVPNFVARRVAVSSEGNSALPRSLATRTSVAGYQKPSVHTLLRNHPRFAGHLPITRATLPRSDSRQCYLSWRAGCVVLVCPFTAPSHAKPRLQGWGFCRSEPLDAMSAIGTKRTSLVAPHMSAFGGKADMALLHCKCPLMTQKPDIAAIGPLPAS